MALLERAVPGQSLTARVHAGRDDDATLILCDVIAALHRPEPPHVGFPGVAAWGSALDAEPPADRRLPKAMLARARGLQDGDDPAAGLATAEALDALI
jgi:streptomycin 6-kinase